MKSGCTVTIDRTKELQKALAALTKDDVLVGVPAQKAEREDPADDGHEPINNAALAYLQNYGSPANNIPARPFMEPGIAAAKPKIVTVYEKAAKAALDTGGKGVDQAHEKVGLIAQGAIQEKITDGPFAPLAESTIAARKRAGFTSITPLIVSGQLRRAISYVVRRRGS